jgi:hypothetical protein
VHSGELVLSHPKFPSQKGVLYLLEDRLQFDAADNTSSVHISVKWKLLEPFVDEDSVTGEEIYGFTITGKHSGTYEFQCGLNTELDEWLDVLSPRMIVSNIEEDYEFYASTFGKTEDGAQVRCAVDLDDHSPYSVKTYPKMADSPIGKETRSRIVNEIEILRGFEGSEHFQTFNKVYEDDNGVYLVMDIYSGKSMKDRLRNIGRYTET